MTTYVPEVTSYFIIDEEKKKLIFNIRNKQGSTAVPWRERVHFQVWVEELRLTKMPESKFKLRAAVILWSVNMLFINTNWLAELALSYST